jgi:plastocyanin
MKYLKHAVLFLLLAVAVLTGACKQASSLTPGPVQTNSVSLIDFQYSPADISIKTGTTVTWTNNGSSVHTVTSAASSTETFDSGDLNPGAIFTHTFNSTGTFHYFCMHHSQMLGSVAVAN